MFSLSLHFYVPVVQKAISGLTFSLTPFQFLILRRGVIEMSSHRNVSPQKWFKLELQINLLTTNPPSLKTIIKVPFLLNDND